MDNYIVLNGKKAELTAEQLKALGIVTEKKSPFERCKRGEAYYFISYDGCVTSGIEIISEWDDAHFDRADYCTDKNLLQQRAWHETLSRLLWRYSMEHDGDKIDWGDNNQHKYRIVYGRCSDHISVAVSRLVHEMGVYFYTEEIANDAIKEIVKPFMAKHPYFIW